MNEKVRALCVVGLVGVGFSPATVYAQSTPPSSTSSRTDVTVFGVSHSTTRASVGWSVAHFWKPEVGFESEVTHGADVLTGGASLIWALPNARRLTPFLAGGAGFERQELDSESRTRVALTFGGGASVTAHQRLAIRGDVRWINQRWRLGSGVSVSF